MRLLLLLSIVDVFASHSIIAVDQEDLDDLWDLLKTKIIKYPKEWYKRSPIGIGLEKSANELFKRGHNEQKNSNDKYPPRESDVIFWCTNSDQQSAQIKLNDANVKEKLTADKSINFVIHGFQSGLKEEWINKTVRDWIKYRHCNVCAVDWSTLAGEINYLKVATKYTKLVANAIHRFMTFLIEKQGMDIGDVSIAGHSLGAHIAGLVGASFNGKIKAIYGLDPAGPGFANIEDDDIKLDKNDAQHVQCIYTDGNVFGTEMIYGNCHQNFFANDGRSQPGCLNSLTEFLTCDHSRACDYFQESFDSTHRFWGTKCPINTDTPIDVLFGRSNVDSMGIHSFKRNGNFCVYTNSKFPYARSKEDLLNKILRLTNEDIWITLMKKILN